MRIATPSVLVLTLFAGSAISSPTLLSHADTLHPRLSHSGSIGGVYTIDLSGLSSWDTQGDESNDILEIFFGANIPVVGIGWDVNIQTFGTSWLSEATLNIEDELFIAPGVGDDMPGTMSYSSGGIIDLYSKGLDFYVGDDGIF